MIPVPKGKVYNIIIHFSTDFDSLASIYLVTVYLINGAFPKYTDDLIEYVEIIDSGRMSIDKLNLKCPATVANFLEMSV
ncbi:hypothetical protein [Oceanirhabdus seepicola]|uniref:Uncharacterized protein n=1 Tax=Oceanirhabdus seepicola TaxID=2828781 RepID=A0A9J6P8Y0_9CLOT|nr:hypothetical protein [Oceanirhabdus seepicola]MCM1992791.1 hypothetical protein [Oceanirhabdus seepicola]